MKEKDGVFYINKPKKELSSYERLLLKYQPHKYKLVKKKKKKNKLPKEVREYQEELKFWNEVDKYMKNPEKYKNKKTKRDKMLEKYFKEDNYRNKINKKKNADDINKNMILFLENITYEKDKERMYGNKSTLDYYNKSLMESLGELDFGTSVDVSDKDEMSMLKAVENELLSALNDDLFEENLIVQYYEGNKKKLKKRLKPKKNKKKHKNIDAELDESMNDREYLSHILGEYEDDDEDMINI